MHMLRLRVHWFCKNMSFPIKTLYIKWFWSKRASIILIPVEDLAKVKLLVSFFFNVRLFFAGRLDEVNKGWWEYWWAAPDWLQGATVILLPSLPRVMRLRSPEDCLACPLIISKTTRLSLQGGSLDRSTFDVAVSRASSPTIFFNIRLRTVLRDFYFLVLQESIKQKSLHGFGHGPQAKQRFGVSLSL